jgi:hypothetical protein
VQTLQEDDPRWRRHTRWDYREDATREGLATGYGFRTATDRGRSVLEVGYGLGEYGHIGDVLEIPSAHGGSN